MYTETITRDGDTTTSRVSDAAALSVLRRGIRLGCTVTAAQDGTVTIVRTVLHLAGEDVTETRVIVTLIPDAKPLRLTKTQYEDLVRVRSAGNRAVLQDSGRIGGTALFWQIPPSAAKRLFDKGFVVTVGVESRVEVTIAGLLAMALFEHPAHTTAPRGWHDADAGFVNTVRNHRRHPYKVADFTSAAACTCGFRRVEDRRDGAVRAVRGHLVEKLSAALAA